MTGQGRPVRFLALVALGWISVRFALVWMQGGSLPEAIQAVMPLASARTGAGAVSAPAQRHPARTAPPPTRIAARPPAGALARTSFPHPGPDPARVQMALLALVQYGAPATVGAVAMPLPPTAQPELLPRLPSRWSASAWFVARPGTGLGAAPGGSQLGGSQAGLRVAYLLAPRPRVAIFARAVTPLKGKGVEGSLGVEWQPTRAPVRLVVEQRFGLDGMRGGTGIGAIGGFDGAMAGVRLESYGQAGAIRRARTEPYADGAVRATRTLVEDKGVRLAFGGGAWGAAQRDAARVDVGPSATLALPVAGQNLRVALDWRQRVAGSARPGSGLALTLGSDF